MLGYEQILAGDFSADKFPAPGEWYLSVSVAGSETRPAEFPLDLEITVGGEAQPSSANFASADAGDPTLTIALAARVLPR